MEFCLKSSKVDTPKVFKPRRVIKVSIPIMTQPISVYDFTLDTTKHSIACRVVKLLQDDGTFKDPPQPKKRAFNNLRPIGKAIAIQTTSILGCAADPCSEEEFVQMCAPSKRPRYRRALKYMEENGWNSKHARIKYFVKCEKMDFGSKPRKAPRAVQPRDYVYQLALGRYIKPIEHIIYEAIAQCFGDSPTVIKGYNVDEIGCIVKNKWDKFENPCAIGWDAVSFDQHVSVDALKYEHYVYNEIYRYNKELKELLKLQLHNKGYGITRDGFKFNYDVKGGRMSGDQNTALGNCIIMCSLVKEFLNQQHIRAELLNNGDDCVLILDKADLHLMPTFKPFALNYGFNMVLEEPVFDMEKIEFCQHQPVMVDGSPRMVRKPFTCFTKDTIINDVKITQQQYHAWSHAVCDGGVALNSGVPIQQTFYEFLGSCPLPVKKNQVKMNWNLSTNCAAIWAKGIRHRKSKEISYETRMSYFRAFDIQPVEQVYLEDIFKDLENKYISPVDEIVTEDPTENLELIYNSTLHSTNQYFKLKYA